MPDLLRYGKRPVGTHRNRQQLYRKSMELRERKYADHIIAKTNVAESNLISRQQTLLTEFELWVPGGMVMYGDSQVSPSGFLRPKVSNAAGGFADNSLALSERPKTKRSALQQECDQLRVQNDQLADELSQVRALLSKIVREAKDTELSSPRVAGMFDNRAVAAEMLAALDDVTESEMVLNILGSEGQSVSDLIQSADAFKVVRVAGMLANCRAAFVHADAIVPTEFGRALFNWIVGLNH